MTSGEPARRAGRRRPRTALAALSVVAVALVGFLGHRWFATSGDHARATPRVPVGTVATGRPLVPGPHDGPLRDQEDAVGEADGVVPDGATVFDDEYPAVAKLDPDLLRALRQAARDAARDGVELDVDSGWRSPAYQQQLLSEAIAKYGSEEEAARWVATPDTSPHVSGDAVDIGPSAARAWLSEHGAVYRLCQTYRNEPWHYELRPEAAEHGCPPLYRDATQDPRMQQ